MSEPFHTQYFLALSMLSITVACILRVHIVYVDKDVIAESTRVSLPVIESQVAVAVILLSTLLIVVVWSSTLGLVVPIGRPRYVKGIEPL